MRIFLLSFLSLVLFIAAPAQSREETLDKINLLKEQIRNLEKTMLEPEAADSAAARRENVSAFRILPREIYEKKIQGVRGGGAYYSFTSASHDYNRIPQISFEQKHLSVGFYGASYGFLTDLGEISLGEVDAKTNAVAFMANYRPPLEESKARVEASNSRDFVSENVVYKNRLPAIVGHTYLLRAVSYDEADVLVAFRIHRRDADGSLIIFWKMLENFEKPQLARK